MNVLACFGLFAVAFSGLGFLLVAILALALVWMLVAKLPIDATWKQILQVVIICIAILAILRAAGLI